MATSLLLVAALAPLPAGAIDGVSEKFRITTASAAPATPFEAFDTTNIAAFDLDGDGVKEIIAHNDNNNVYVFSGKDGSLIAELETNHPSWWRTRELAGIAIGDVNGNGRMDLVVTNSAAFLTVFETRADENGMRFEKLWERFMDPTDEEPDYEENHPWLDWNGRPGLDGAPYLADARGDDADEIFLQLDDDPGLYALTGDGETYGWNSWSEGNANPIATDLTGDGKIEAAYPSDGGRIFIFKGADFRFQCSFNARAHGAMPGSISVAPTAVDLTGDGRKELVFGTRQAVEDPNDPEWFKKQHAHYFAIRSDCSVLWHKTFDWGNPHNHMHPIPVDVDNDGELDVVFQDWNTIGHKPGKWQVTGKPNFFALKGATGELIWQVETTGFWSNSNVALADITGDGEQEFLVVAEHGGRDGVKSYSLSGSATGHVAAPSGWVVNRGPAVVDLDGDGRLEMIVPVMRASDHCTRTLDVGCRQGALVVYETSGTERPLWANVKTYNHAYDDAGMPAQATPVEIPPPEEPAEPEEEPATPEEGLAQPIEEMPQAEEDADAEPDRDGPPIEAEATPAEDDEGENTTEPENATAQGVDGTGEDGSNPGATNPAPSGGGGGGGSAPPPIDPPTEPATETPEPPSPVIEFGSDFPAPGEPHGPLAPIVVYVSGSSPIRSVELLLDGEPLGVEFDGERAVHTPREPLPAGNHVLTVRATDANGLTTSVDRPLVVLESAPEPDPGGDPAPRDSDGDSSAAVIPLGPLVVFAALAVVVAAAVRMRRA